jgi:hypothetical protein
MMNPFSKYIYNFMTAATTSKSSLLPSQPLYLELLCKLNLETTLSTTKLEQLTLLSVFLPSTTSAPFFPIHLQGIGVKHFIESRVQYALVTLMQISLVS